MKIPEAINNAHSRYNEIMNRRMTKALILSAALHMPIVHYDTMHEVWNERGNIVHAIKEKIKAALQRPFEKSRYEDELREALENGEHVDLAEFTLKSQFSARRIDESRMQEALEGFDEIEQKIREENDENDQIATLRAIVEAEGEYESGLSYLSAIILEKVGNCKARARFTAALIDRIYPDMEIQYQKVRVNGERHIRTLARVDGKWYSMEDLDKPMTEYDMMGTVLYEKHAPLRHYLGEEVGEYKKPIVKIDTPTKITVTDDYEDMPLPDGVSADNIKDIASTDPKATGVPLSASGYALAGTPVSPNGNTDGPGDTVPFLYGHAGWKNPTEVEVISVEEAKRREEISSKWTQYLNPPPPPPVLPSETGLIQAPNFASGNSSGLSEIFSNYVFSLLNHTKDVILEDSTLISHSLFQNDRFFYPFYSEVCSDNACYYQVLMRKICQSRTLQESLYQWTLPVLKKTYLALDMEARKKHLATLKHLREYLNTFDYKKEKQYLERVIEDEGAFVRFSPDTYPGQIVNEQVRNAEWEADFSKLDLQVQLARSNRYAEAFMFRRIEDGMSVEDARYWVDRGIAEMESIINEPQVKFEAD